MRRLATIRLRTMLVLVALFALVLSLGASQRRKYSSRAAYYARCEDRLSQLVLEDEQNVIRAKSGNYRVFNMGVPGTPDGELDARQSLTLARSTLARRSKILAYYTRLRQKYSYASEYPWTLVGPDPPPP